MSSGNEELAPVNDGPRYKNMSMSCAMGSCAAAGWPRNADKSAQSVGPSGAGADNSSTGRDTRGGPTAESRDAG